MKKSPFARSAIALVAVAALSLAGCGSSNSAGDKPTSNANSPAPSQTQPAPSQGGDTTATDPSAPDTSESSPASEPAAPAAPDGLVVPGQLTVCISNGTFEPMYSSEGGKLTGFAPDMYRALAKLWGIDVKFDPMAFAGQIPSLQAKRCDFLAELSITAERLKTLDGIAWMNGGMSLLVPEGNPKNIQTRADLAGLTVAVLQSSTAAEILEELNKTEFKANGLKEVNIQIYPGAPESYAAVVNGKADAVLDQSLAKNLISKRMDGKIVPLSDELFAGLGEQPFGLYMNKGNPILEPTTDGLKNLYDSGELAKIAQDNDIDPALLITPVSNPDDVG